MQAMHIMSFSVSFLITFVSVIFIRPFAFKKGILDIPNGTLKVHEHPTPYLGGIAVFCGTLPFFIALVISKPLMIFLFLGLTLLLIVGLIDDLYVITPLQKIIGQLVAGLCFLKAQFCFTPDLFIYISPFLSSYVSLNFLTILADLASLFWMLIIINACNLIDIMDGLLAVLGITIISSWLITVSFFNVGQVSYLYINVVMAFFGSLAAFFWCNKPRASIYSGDAGSLFIGGFLSILPFFIYDWQKINDLPTFFLPFFIFFIPLIEVCTLIIIRTKKRIPFYYGSPHHFICYLKKNGWSVWAILFLVALMSLIFGASGIFVAFYNNSKTMLLFTLTIICFFWTTFVFMPTIFNFPKKIVVFLTSVLRF